jgi:TonB-linked SusC/RagA family outer membrane protein
MVVGVLFAAPAAATAQATTGRVTGAVMDSATSQPVPGANVTIVGTALGVQTGGDGRYTVNGVPVGERQLRVQRIGYAAITRPITVRAGEVTTVDVSMHATSVQLDAVVSIGYGTQSRRNVTGAVSTVTTEALDKAPIQTVDQLLQGTSPGVQVTTASSEPGGALSVRIRGTSSITGNAEPLYVIDGFPVENDMDDVAAGNGGRTRTTPPNPLVTLSPSDIESVSILKDASATAIYGARGANGVVIITTRQGRGTKPTFTIDSYTGASAVAKRYDLLNAAQFMDYANTYAQNSSTPYLPFPDSVKRAILAAGTNTDWQDQVFRVGSVNNLQLSMRGATNATSPTRYALSGGYFNQQGVVVGSGLRRLSARLNVDQTLGSRVQLGGTVTAAQARSKATPTAGQQNGNAGAVSAALQYVPILPVRRADGSYSYIFTDLNAYNSLLDAPQTPNPVSLTSDVLDSLSDTRVLGTFYGQADLTRDLKLRVTLGTDYSNRWRDTYYSRSTLRGGNSNGDALRGATTTSSWLNENTLTYQHAFGGGVHDIALLGGYSSQLTNLDGSSMENTNFVSDITGYFDIGAGTQTGGPTISSRNTTQTLESYLSRFNYSLLDRYLLTLTYRADGSSRFAQNKKWGDFPSAALAWRASSEPWFRVPSITDLKFRASYGLVGNPSIRPYQSLARLNNQGYSFGGTASSGYYVEAVGNPDLTWETTRQSDGGMDLTLFNRATLTADAYYKRTTNLLLQVSLPLETGFESALANVGAVENRGVELGLDLDVVHGSSGRAFSWHANVNFAKNKNKVLNLGGQQSIFADFITTDYNLPGTVIRVGQPIGMFFGYKSGGIIRDSAEAAQITWKNFNGSSFKRGQTKILDIAGVDSAGKISGPDGKIDANDRTIIGDPTPSFTYGFTNTFDWKGFQLTGLLQGQFGGKVLNVNRIRTESSPRVNVSVDRYLDAWSPTNPGGKYPVIGENPNQVGTNDFTDNLLESASYVRLRTLTASWGVPARFLTGRGITGARIYVTGTNLFTISKYSGFDPDVSSQSVGNVNRGIDIGAYPLARAFTTGISLNF